jgi:hypothetical protein
LTDIEEARGRQTGSNREQEKKEGERKKGKRMKEKENE